MSRLSADELIDAHQRQSWNVLWKEAVPWVKYAVLSVSKNSDEDMLQEGYAAAGIAMRSWNPIKGAFSTHLCACVRGACLTYLEKRGAGGIGAGRQRKPSSIVPAEVENTEGDNAELSYGDTQHTPEGFGDAGRELQRETATDAIQTFLEGLTEAQKAAMLAVFTERAPTNTTQRTLVRSTIRKLARKQKTAYIGDTKHRNRVNQTHKAAARYPGFWNGLVGVMGDVPAWRESTGKVWNDWSWKPEGRR